MSISSCAMMFSYLRSLLAVGSARNSERVSLAAVFLLVLRVSFVGVICPSSAPYSALILLSIAHSGLLYFFLFAFSILFLPSHSWTCKSVAMLFIAFTILVADFLDPVAFATRVISELDMYP